MSKGNWRGLCLAGVAKGPLGLWMFWPPNYTEVDVGTKCRKRGLSDHLDVNETLGCPLEPLRGHLGLKEEESSKNSLVAYTSTLHGGVRGRRELGLFSFQLHVGKNVLVRQLSREQSINGPRRRLDALPGYNLNYKTVNIMPTYFSEILVTLFSGPEWELNSLTWRNIRRGDHIGRGMLQVI